MIRALSVNFWDHHRARFPEKKNKNTACDVTVGTSKVKIINVQIECQLSHLMMFISNGICQYEWKYAASNQNIRLFST